MSTLYVSKTNQIIKKLLTSQGYVPAVAMQQQLLGPVIQILQILQNKK